MGEYILCGFNYYIDVLLRLRHVEGSEGSGKLS